MNISFVLAAQNSGSAGAPTGGGDLMSMLFPLLLLIIMFVFFVILPQRKKQKQLREFQNSLKEGDNVVTGGGIYGTVKHIDIQTGKIKLSIAKDVVIEVDKAYVFKDTTAAMQQQK